MTSETVEGPSYSGASDAGSVRRKLKQIGLALHNLHDVNRGFLPLDERGEKQRLSWRVYLLPYLDQQPLYNRFKLDEPWDSEHNLKLLDQMPDIYTSGGEEGMLTRFQVLIGPSTLFETPKNGRIRDCTDGARHTILVLQTGKDHDVPWTKPADLTYDPDAPVSCVGEMDGGRIECLMANGELLSVRTDILPETFAALATANGSEVVDVGTVRKEHSPAPGLSDLLVD